jgi:hypothetical protein
MRRFTASSIEEIIKGIGEWLAQANDQDGGRKDRARPNLE